MGWTNTIVNEKTNGKVRFDFDNRVYENVFLEPAIAAGTINNASSPQAKLITQNNWSWAVGPPYEWTIIEDKPELTEIPKLWPRESVRYMNLEMQVSGGGDWDVEKTLGQPWCLLFDEGLEVTGTGFNGSLFTNYSYLASHVDENNKDNKEILCLLRCIQSRKKGSYCNTTSFGKGYVKADCELRFFEPFPPPECTHDFWKDF